MNTIQTNQVFEFVLTFVDLLALVCLLGTLTCRLWIVPTEGSVQLTSRILQLLTRIGGISLTALAITSLAQIWWRSATLSGESAFNVLAMLPIIMTQTHAGHIWLIRIVTIAVAGFLWILVRRGQHRDVLWWMILCTAAILAFSRSASGHAADAGDFTLKEWVDWAHLMAVSIWVGSVLVVSLVVFPVLAKLDRAHPEFIAQFTNRLSRSSGIALGVVLLAGIYNAWSRLGGFTALFDTPYGWTLDTKLILVGIAIIFGAINRFVHVRRINNWTEASAINISEVPEQSLLVSNFYNTVRLEAVVLLLVLLATTFLLQQIPPNMSMSMGGKNYAQEFSFGGPDQPTKATRIIQIEATDEMRFKPDSITVGTDEIVRFDVINTGKIWHEFVLGDEKAQREHEAEMQDMHMRPDKFPDENNAISIAPGETKFITWRFPAKPGEIFFACHEQGHFASGMKGTIVIVTPDS